MQLSVRFWSDKVLEWSWAAASCRGLQNAIKSRFSEPRVPQSKACEVHFMRRPHCLGRPLLRLLLLVCRRLSSLGRVPREGETARSFHDTDFALLQRLRVAEVGRTLQVVSIRQQQDVSCDPECFVFLQIQKWVGSAKRQVRDWD